MDECLLIGRDVEAFRENAISGRLGQAQLLLLDYFGAMLTQPADNFIHSRRGGPKHIDAGVARVVPLATDPDLTNGESAAVGEDFIQHLWQDQRIDDMAAQFDLFGKHLINECPAKPYAGAGFLSTAEQVRKTSAA